MVKRVMNIFSVICLATIIILAIPVTFHAADRMGQANLVLVLVVDGLRPDCINPTDTPNIYKLQREGVHFVNAHSVFPTVTRVQSASLPTGAYPSTHGLMSNNMYVPEVDATNAINTSNYLPLIQLDSVSGGRLLFVKTLSERLHEKGKLLAALSSGSTGGALLLNHRARQGVGIDVGLFTAGTLVAYPESENREILTRVPPPQPPVSPNASVDWQTKVLNEYLIPVRKPDVVLNWMTEPDGAHHTYGVGDPRSLAAIQNSDRNIGLILEKLNQLGLYDRTDIFVASDHGFSLINFGVNLSQELITAGLKESAKSTDVVLASSGQTVLLHVKDHNPVAIERIVKYLQRQKWAGVIFTAEDKNAFNKSYTKKDKLQYKGWVDGTFSLDIIHAFNKERGADIILTFPWTSDKNSFGYQGTDSILTSSPTGPVTGPGSNHGSMSPWLMRNTLIAWGVDFKKKSRNPVPAGNVDITPTILALMGIGGDKQIDGRVLTEALSIGPDEEKVPVETVTYSTVLPGSYKAYLQVSYVDGKRYIDKSWLDKSGQ